MTIYQVIRADGECDDYHQYSIGAYLHKPTAESKLKELQDETEERLRCGSCPYSTEYPNKPIPTACPDHSPVNVFEGIPDEDAEYYCENREDDYYKLSFWIEELEVNEEEL